jgi:GntR family transcriptional regulator
MQEDYSVVAKTSREEISAIPASKYLSENLGIDESEPVLKRQRYVYDPGRRPIEFGLAYYKSDSIVYTVESVRPE